MPRKSSIKTIKNKADRLFSEFVRSLGYCEWCGKRPPAVQLQCSHIFSRRFLVTRWEPINATCLCAGCHRRWHDKPIEGVEWIKGYLGEDVYDELRVLAKTGINKNVYDGLIERIKEYKHA